MLYYLSQYVLDLGKGTAWGEGVSFLRLFRYITVRSAGAAITALALSWWLGPKVIAWLRRLKFGQQYQDKAEAAGIRGRAFDKKGTPSMGGMLVVTVMDVTALLWAQWNVLLAVTLLSVIVLMGLGFLDDYSKITEQSSRGAAMHVKLWVQFTLAIFIALYLWRVPHTRQLISEVWVPFVKRPVLAGSAVAVSLSLIHI